MCKQEDASLTAKRVPVLSFSPHTHKKKTPPDFQRRYTSSTTPHKLYFFIFFFFRHNSPADIGDAMRLADTTPIERFHNSSYSKPSHSSRREKTEGHNSSV